MTAELESVIALALRRDQYVPLPGPGDRQLVIGRERRGIRGWLVLGGPVVPGQLRQMTAHGTICDGVVRVTYGHVECEILELMGKPHA